MGENDWLSARTGSYTPALPLPLLLIPTVLRPPRPPRPDRWSWRT